MCCNFVQCFLETIAIDLSLNCCAYAQILTITGGIPAEHHLDVLQLLPLLHSQDEILTLLDVM